VDVFGVIPARGGSRGVPRKNLVDILGKPLVAWTIQAAQQSRLMTRFAVSTEDEEIAEVSAVWGADILKRPNCLAADDTTTISVIQNIHEEVRADVYVVLQPTSPIRDDGLIDRCIQKFMGEDVDNLATGYICKTAEFGTHNNERRQDLEGFFYDDGNIYVLSSEIVVKGQWFGERISKMILGNDQSFEIDEPMDVCVAEALLAHRINQRTGGAAEGKGRQVKLLAFDVDGVLTDAGMYYGQSGEELKKFNTRDGKGIELARNAGITTAILTSEKTAIVQNRAEKLNVDYVYQGVTDKLSVMNNLAAEVGVDLSDVAYIGDDLNDTELLGKVGLSATPSDGILENKKIVDYVCAAGGGGGCLREFVELILAGQETQVKARVG
jgi:YrbI family 3-deoxy-D-manno-octulosonate 8-phosphate phosphatase